MNLLRTSIILRWFFVWIGATLLILLEGILVQTLLRHTQPVFGPDILLGIVSAGAYSAPWFIWGALLAYVVRDQKQYSSVGRILAAIGLFLGALLCLTWTLLPTIDL